MRGRTAIACALVMAAVLGGAGPLCAVACAAEPGHPGSPQAAALAGTAAPCHGHEPQAPPEPRGGPCDAGCNHSLAAAPDADALLAQAFPPPAAPDAPTLHAPAPLREAPTRTSVADASPPDLVLLHSSLRL